MIHYCKYILGMISMLALQVLEFVAAMYVYEGWPGDAPLIPTVGVYFMLGGSIQYNLGAFGNYYDRLVTKQKTFI